MKAMLLYLGIFALVILLAPMLALNFDLDLPGSGAAPVHAPALPSSQAEAPPAPEVREEAAGGEESAPAQTPPAAPGPAEAELSVNQGAASFRILDESTGQVAEIGLRDFVRGAVAAEMPVSFHSEALKAQAVAAHTFALHNHLAQQQTPDPALKGADFSADPGNLKVYMTEAQARKFYGDAADQSWKKICAAADSVLEYVLEYEEEPIVAAYHAISAGQTEDAANVWTGEAPYLLPADSGGDLLAPDYESSASFSQEELRAALKKAYPNLQLRGDPAGWFGEPVRSGSGYVTEIPVGDATLHGKEIRQLLDLRSHNFEVAYSEGVFTFQVFGYGHGVGLSQYGADFLARQGYPFDKILANYYAGATLRKVKVDGEG